MKYLLIEDNQTEIDAVRVLLPEPEDLVSTFSEARELLETKTYDGVITDMYFPFGGESEFLNESDFRVYVAKFFSDYANRSGKCRGPRAESLSEYVKSREEDCQLSRALCLTANIMGEDDPLALLNLLDNPGNKVIESNLEREFERYSFHEDMRSHARQIRHAEHLAPMGLAIVEHCEEQNIPYCVVTGDYHHGPKFQAICNRVARYVDTVDKETNLKGWEQGYDILKNLIKRDAA